MKIGIGSLPFSMPVRLLDQIIGDGFASQLAERLLKTESEATAEARLGSWLTDASIAELHKERYLPNIPTQDILINYPAGSLGHELSRLYQERGFNPKFYKEFEGDDSFTYIRELVSQTHDIWHLVTGFDFNLIGEVGLQALIAAQLNNSLSFAMIGLSLLSQLGCPDTIESMMDKIQEGWRMGKSLEYTLLGVRWEPYLTRPLLEVRRELKLGC